MAAKSLELLHSMPDFPEKLDLRSIDVAADICLDRALYAAAAALKVNALETFPACQPEIQFRTVRRAHDH
jgi:hypothetical protein